jgi:beta-fructofuranosidase
MTLARRIPQAEATPMTTADVGNASGEAVSSAGRPEFHFTANEGWVNDPLGLHYRDGRYHLFFQHVPGSTVWAPNCHWGHATSTDLVSWHEGPVAVRPGEGDDGIWSGSIAVEDDGSATMFYTSVNVPDFGIGRVRTATPGDDDLTAWVKGPVVVSAPIDLDVVAFRDPFVFRDGAIWRMLVGTGLAGGVAAASSFSSADLTKWSYDGVALSRAGTDPEPVWTGTLWECPQVFEVDGRQVFVTSVWEDDVLHHAVYAIGRYAEGTFAPEAWGRLTYGDSYYAPSFFRDKDGRPAVIFWMRGFLDAERSSASALSVPHLLRLDGDRLIAEPHTDLERFTEILEPTVASLRGDTAYLIEWPLEPDQVLALHQEEGIHLELRATAGGLTVTDPGGSVHVPSAGGRVRVLIDGPTVEIFTNAGAVGFGLQGAGRGPIAVEGHPESIAALRRPKESSHA